MAVRSTESTSGICIGFVFMLGVLDLDTLELLTLLALLVRFAGVDSEGAGLVVKFISLKAHLTQVF